MNRLDRSLFTILFLTSSTCLQAQSLTGTAYDTKSIVVPRPGSGQSYIGALNEVVDPSTGAVNLTFNLPVPQSRGFTFPYALRYGSNQVRQLDGGNVGFGQLQGIWVPALYANRSVNSSNGSGGWSDSIPTIASAYYDASIYVGGNIVSKITQCNSFTFTDLNGQARTLGGQTQYISYGPDAGFSVLTGGADETYGLTFNSSGYILADQNGLKFVGTDPTLLGIPVDYSIPCGQRTVNYIEDANGNITTISAPRSNPTALTVTDSLGRPVITTTTRFDTTKTDSILASGLEFDVSWTTTSSSIAVPSVAAAGNSAWPLCTVGPPAINDTQSVVHSLTLPNGQSYTFYYGSDNPDPSYNNPYGLLSEIDFPDGGWIRYTWKWSDTMSDSTLFGALNPDGDGSVFPYACYYKYQSPVVATRTVGNVKNGPAVFTQAYTYNTDWGMSTGLSANYEIWTAKKTDVVSNDLVSNLSYLTRYTYSSGGAQKLVKPALVGSPPLQPQDPPVETSATYFSGNTDTSGVLKTVTSSWYLPDLPTSKQTTLDDGETSKSTYCYYGLNCAPSWPALLKEVDEYGYGQSQPTRVSSTQYDKMYDPFGNTLAKPCESVVLNQFGIKLSETDTYYDGETSPCQGGAGVSTVAIGNLYPGGHDEANYSAMATAGRGNATKVVAWQNSGPSPASTFTYDETGMKVSATSPCGNGMCSDLVGSNNTTQYSYQDAYDPNSGATAFSSNAYVTAVTYPNTGRDHIERSTWNFLTGQQTSKTDQNGNLTQIYYADPLRRVTQIVGPPDPTNSGASNTLTYAYNDNSTNPSVTTSVQKDAGGAELSAVDIRDGMQHVIQSQVTTDPEGIDYIDRTFTGSDELYSLSNNHRASQSPLDGTTSYQYDALGRKLFEFHQDNGSVTGSDYLSWSYSGSAVNSYDENQNAWSRTYDAFGNLMKVLEPNGTSPAGALETDYKYDALNRLVGVSQCGGPCPGVSGVRRWFQYDSLSHLILAGNPEAGTICYGTIAASTAGASVCSNGYDLNGNLQFRTDARGIQTSYRYDVLHRIVSQRYSGDPSNTATTCFIYDDTSISNSNGKMTQLWTQPASRGDCGSTLPSFGIISAKMIKAYNPMGLILEEIQCVLSTCTAGAGFDVTAMYDLAGEVRSYSDGVGANPSGASIVLSTSYDNAGHLETLTSNWVDSHHPATLFSIDNQTQAACASGSTVVAYTAGGLLLNAIFGGGLEVSRMYDNRYRLNCNTGVSTGGATAVPGSATIQVVGRTQSK